MELSQFAPVYLLYMIFYTVFRLSIKLLNILEKEASPEPGTMNLMLFGSLPRPIWFKSSWGQDHFLFISVNPALGRESGH